MSCFWSQMKPTMKIYSFLSRKAAINLNICLQSSQNTLNNISIDVTLWSEKKYSNRRLTKRLSDNFYSEGMFSAGILFLQVFCFAGIFFGRDFCLQWFYFGSDFFRRCFFRRNLFGSDFFCRDFCRRDFCGRYFVCQSFRPVKNFWPNIRVG